MDAAIIGFGGCGKNILEALCIDEPEIKTVVLEDYGKEFLESWQPAGTPNSYSPENLEKLVNDLSQSRVCFLVGGLGGETCTHMPAFARRLREADVLTMALLTYPFKFENKTEKARAELQELENSVNAFMVFDNNEPIASNSKDASLQVALQTIQQAMLWCIRAVLAQTWDLADIRACLKGRIFNGIAHSKDSLMEAYSSASRVIEEVFATAPRPSGVATALFGNEGLADVEEEIRKAHDLLDGDNACWLFAFESPRHADIKSVVILAS